MKRTFLALLFIANLGLAQSTYEFLRTDMSPRASALGGSFVANSDDADVIFYNPAGIISLTETPVSFSFVKHLLDINLASFSISREFENIGRFGAAVKYINYGSFTGADEFGNRNGEYGAGEFAFLLGYAGKLDDNFYYGSNVKFIYSGIQDYSSTAVGFDIGLHYAVPNEDIHIGLAIQNIGTQLSSYIDTNEKLPLDITVGFSGKLKHLPLRLFLDFHKLNKESDNLLSRFKYFTVGGEFTLSRVLTLRVGFENEKRKELKIGTFAVMAGFNIGLGINIKEYNFDYAYSSFGEIGALHRIGVKTVF
jgi:hypothetical protein